MSNAILKLLYSESGEEDYITCDVCAHKIENKELEICPNCKKRIKLPTLQEYGKRLPVGIVQDDELLKDFDIEPLNWGKEKKVSTKLNSQEWKRKMTLSNYIGMILAYTVKSIGGRDISSFSIEKKLNLFKEMYQGDIFYMYAYLRLITSGSELALQNIECTNNGDHKFGCIIDVSSIKIMNIESINELYREFELKDGIMLDKELRKKITIIPPKWKVLSMSSNTSEAEVLEKIFLDSIYKIEGFSEELQFPEAVLNNLSKNDMNIIEENVNYMTTGPLWVAELTCPQCETEMLWAVDWTFKDFFTSSYTLGRR